MPVSRCFQAPSSLTRGPAETTPYLACLINPTPQQNALYWICLVSATPRLSPLAAALADFLLPLSSTKISHAAKMGVQWPRRCGFNPLPRTPCCTRPVAAFFAAPRLLRRPSTYISYTGTQTQLLYLAKPSTYF